MSEPLQYSHHRPGLAVAVLVVVRGLEPFVEL